LETVFDASKTEKGNLGKKGGEGKPAAHRAQGMKRVAEKRSVRLPLKKLRPKKSPQPEKANSLTRESKSVNGICCSRAGKKGNGNVGETVNGEKRKRHATIVQGRPSQEQ